MGLGRRKIGLEQQSAWVFNRMADVYDARPPYPAALIEALAGSCAKEGAVLDLGAGIGHLSLPLAERGFEVYAVEPAALMLERLRSSARERGLHVHAVHAAAEALPLETASCSLVLVADALHFLDAQRAGAEITRVLAPGGALAVVFAQLADTPFMRSVVEVMNDSAPRRPRAVLQTLQQLTRVAGVELTNEQRFNDHTPVDPARLERILRSISYIGPAMNVARFARFRERIHALSDTPVWSREFVVHSGHKRQATR